MLIAVAVLSCSSAAAAADIAIAVSTDAVAATTPRNFLAHGWESFQASSANLTDPRFVTTFAHLRGQSIRIGGISADFFLYTDDAAVTSACNFSHRPFTPARSQCPFSTGAFDALMEFLEASGVDVLFDLNEIVGRNCTQVVPNAHPWNKNVNEYCGDVPAPWDTAPVEMLLTHIATRQRSGGLSNLIGFELGNELFLPKHLPVAVANADIATAVELLASAWSGGAGGARTTMPPPILYASGTNDCGVRNNSDTMEALLATKAKGGVGFSFHNYPGNAKSAGWTNKNLSTFLLNATWLRVELLGVKIAPCLAAWNAGPRKRGLGAIVTEGAAMCGYTFPPGQASISSFIHGFFSIAQLGQYARAGLGMVARWGIPDLLSPKHIDYAPYDPRGVAADFFLYSIFNRTVGHGVLDVRGDDASEALVYAHCANGDFYGAAQEAENNNGTVTIFAANPSSQAATLTLAGLATLPRYEFVLTAPGGNLSSQTPVLNGNVAHPLALSAEGDMPPIDGAFCASRASGTSAAGKGGRSAGRMCGESLVLPPRSQAFFVLLGARAAACSSKAA